MVDNGAIPLFVRLLSSSNLDVIEQAAWALGNISGDCTAYRDLVLAAGALPILCSIDVVCFLFRLSSSPSQCRDRAALPSSETSHGQSPICVVASLRHLWRVLRLHFPFY